MPSVKGGRLFPTSTHIGPAHAAQSSVLNVQVGSYTTTALALHAQDVSVWEDASFVRISTYVLHFMPSVTKLEEKWISMVTLIFSFKYMFCFLCHLGQIRVKSLRGCSIYSFKVHNMFSISNAICDKLRKNLQSWLIIIFIK